MSDQVLTAAGLDDGAPVALRTPLYPIIAVFGLVMFIGAFLTWATPKDADGNDADLSLTGLDAGGWGAGAMVCGLAILALGVLGYFWNPFSDPEATFIAVFSAAALLASLFKIADLPSLFTTDVAVYFDEAGAGIGLWLILLSAALSLASALWILLSRPKAQARLT